MNRTFVEYFLLFLVCVIVQALIFNQIVLFHVAIPVVFIYFIIRLPIDLKLPYLYTLAFLLGLIVDIFSDTPGVNALACTLTAALRTPVYYAYMAKDDVTSRLTPSIVSMGLLEYSKYLLTFIVIYCLLAFSIEYFSFADVKGIAIIVGSSSIFTFVILLAIDCLVPMKG